MRPIIADRERGRAAKGKQTTEKLRALVKRQRRPDDHVQLSSDAAMMDLTKSALIRGWIQGVGWDVLGEHYLDDADKPEVMRVVRQIRINLALKAQRLRMENHAGIWANDREYSQDWINKALESVKILQAYPIPYRNPMIFIRCGCLQVWPQNLQV